MSKSTRQQTGSRSARVNFSRAFEIYVNGERLMASGQVVPFVPYTSERKTPAHASLIACWLRGPS